MKRGVKHRNNVVIDVIFNRTTGSFSTKASGSALNDWLSKVKNLIYDSLGNFLLNRLSFVHRLFDDEEYDINETGSVLYDSFY